MAAVNSPIQPVWYAVIASCMAAIAPVLTWWMARKDKEQDWKRQDALADRQLAAHKVQEQSNQVIDSKLDAIHTLNNGAAKAGLERELDDAVAKLVMLKLIASLQKGKIDPDAQSLIEDTKKKIERLKKAIADHERQTVIAEKHIDNAAPIPSPSSPGLPSPKTLY